MTAARFRALRTFVGRTVYVQGLLRGQDARGNALVCGVRVWCRGERVLDTDHMWIRIPARMKAGHPVECAGVAFPYRRHKSGGQGMGIGIMLASEMTQRPPRYFPRSAAHPYK